MSEPKFKSIFYVGISTILIIILFAASAYSTEPFNPVMPKKLQAKLSKPVINLQTFNQI